MLPDNSAAPGTGVLNATQLLQATFVAAELYLPIGAST